MIRLLSKKIRGFSLVEILLGLGLFAIIIGGVSLFAVDSFRSSRNAQMRVRAIAAIQEITTALIINKDDSWLTIANASDGLPKHIEFSSNKYSIAEGAVAEGDITLSISIDPVYRDIDGNIVSSGGLEDAHSRSITVTASWIDILGNNQSVDTRFYVNDWNTARWIDTSEPDFNAGTHDLTYVTNTAGGEIELETMLYGDWCNPSLSISSADLPGQGIAQAIWTEVGEVFAGTGANASGLSFIDILVDESDPPIVTIEGTFDGHKTNNVHGEGDVAYIATDTNFKEVVIIDLSVSPFVELGYFDAPGNKDADSIIVSGDYGYTSVEDTLYVFDLSSKIGSRSQVGTGLTLAGYVSALRVVDDYLLVTIDDTSTQLQIIDISDPANLSIVSNTSVNGEGGVDIFVSEDGTRGYLATAASATLDELFILDLSSYTGNRPVVNSYDTNGMDPNGVVTVPDERAIIVGDGGEEYQVIDITDEMNLSKCGGLQVEAGIHDVNAITNLTGNAYSYIVTGDSSDEFKMIKGGLGGGGPGGEGHVELGTFTSRIFDSSSSASYYYFMDWDATVPANTALKMQVRSGNDPTLSGVSWIGPDGTGSTYFTDSSGYTLPGDLNNKRYFQYQVEMTSDTISTPIFEELRLSYQ